MAGECIHILKLVTENSDLFPDGMIEDDPSLGVAYTWARAYQNKYFVTGQRVKLAFPCMENTHEHWHTSEHNRLLVGKVKAERKA